jgi:hypothetical protein
MSALEDKTWKLRCKMCAYDPKRTFLALQLPLPDPESCYGPVFKPWARQ